MVENDGEQIFRRGRVLGFDIELGKLRSSFWTLFHLTC
jgi:hypothetical protein